MRKTIMFTDMYYSTIVWNDRFSTTSEINYDKLMEDDKLRKEAELSTQNQTISRR